MTSRGLYTGAIALGIDVSLADGRVKIDPDQANDCKKVRATISTIFSATQVCTNS